MQIVFQNQAIPARIVSLHPTSLRVGDYLAVRGTLARVITVQKECAKIEDLKYFLMVTAETENGEILPLRNLTGKQHVYRKVGK